MEIMAKQDLGPATIRELSDLFTAEGLEKREELFFAKGTFVYKPEAFADRIFYILEGKIKIGKFSPDGREITKAIISKGDVFGELAIIGQEKRRDFALVMEDCRVCFITKHDMNRLLREKRGLQPLLLKMLGERIIKMEKRLESLVFKDSRTRVIDFLRELARDKGQRVGYEVLVRNFMTHQEIANITATSRQTVTTVLNELRSQNIITFNRKRLLIREVERLG